MNTIVLLTKKIYCTVVNWDDFLDYSVKVPKVFDGFPGISYCPVIDYYISTNLNLVIQVVQSIGCALVHVTVETE